MIMKFLSILAVAIACASASPVANPESDASVLSSQYQIQPEGGYNYKFETGNGIYNSAEGVLKKFDSDKTALEVKGTVKFTAADGSAMELNYVANEKGFYPKGAHIPPAIRRALEYFAARNYEETKQKKY